MSCWSKKRYFALFCVSILFKLKNWLIQYFFMKLCQVDRDNYSHNIHYEILSFNIYIVYLRRYLSASHFLSYMFTYDLQRENICSRKYFHYYMKGFIRIIFTWMGRLCWTINHRSNYLIKIYTCYLDDGIY